MPPLTDARKKSLRREMEALLGAGGVLSDPDELMVYESDGLTLFRALADFVVFPRTAEDVAALVRLANREEIPFVARGAGTGLSGGCLPTEGGELLDRTDAHVWCLIRAGSDQHAAARLREAMRRYLIWDDRSAGRVTPVVGDLTAPGLGLTPARWAELAERIDAVQHAGAQVGHAAPYSALRAANVCGTQEIVRLACERRGKPLSFISTAAVPGDPADRAATPPPPGRPGSGYVTGKWVAERLVRQAGDRGLPVLIHRPRPDQRPLRHRSLSARRRNMALRASRRPPRSGPRRRGV